MRPLELLEQIFYNQGITFFSGEEKMHTFVFRTRQGGEQLPYQKPVAAFEGTYLLGDRVTLQFYTDEETWLKVNEDPRQGVSVEACLPGPLPRKRRFKVSIDFRVVQREHSLTLNPESRVEFREDLHPVCLEAVSERAEAALRVLGGGF
jgi:hypothetical protein